MDDNTEVIRGNDGSWNPLGFGQAFSTPGGSTQQYGFTNNYAPSPQAKALGSVIEALNDPRNAWMGTGLAGGTIRGLGGLRKAFHSPDAGGFNIPTSRMKDLTNSHGLGDERTARDWYLQTMRNLNSTAANIQHGNPLDRAEAFQYYSDVNPQFRSLINKTAQGQQELRVGELLGFGGKIKQ
jgi:hypothetical protein